jgi:hypothetical protein
MNWNSTLDGLKRMAGMKLESISGRSGITLLEVTDDHLSVGTLQGAKSRPVAELKRIARRMDLMAPIHVDSVLMGSGSSRNQPETILANMADVEWLTLNGRKHIIWVGRDTHQPGTIKELDAFNASQVQQQYAGLGAVVGVEQVSNMLILAGDTRLASQLVEALFQISDLQVIENGKAYHSITAGGEIYIVPTPASSKDIEILPLVKVLDRDEAIARVTGSVGGSSIEVLDLDKPVTVVRSEGASFALI